jgi:lysophospholipase L1-like esterase
MVTTAASAPVRRLRRLLAGIAIFALFGGLGLGASELAVGAVRGFAFPYLNLFRSDAVYGVRLAPHAATRTRSREGRVTRVRTNALGFRGPEWTPATAPVKGRVLLLGDSQVFGYGVDEAEAMAARLASRTGGEVLNAAVPTWGPTEYARAAAELVPRYRPEHVVFVGNVANDWFEAKVPNTRRTAARDGWATRAVARAPARDFPGRAGLMSRSQLVFLARSLATVVRARGLPKNLAAEHLARQAGRVRARDGGFFTPLAKHVQRTRDVCARYGCRVTVAALPLDVMVDAREQDKYASPPRDLRAAQRLLDDLLLDSTRLGVHALNLHPVLVDASPGAFLPDDYHLSPRGHDAVAAALAAALRADRRVEEGA